MDFARYDARLNNVDFKVCFLSSLIVFSFVFLKLDFWFFGIYGVGKTPVTKNVK